MWPELIPFLGIMAGALILPAGINMGVNYLSKNGHLQARNEVRNIRDFYGFRRDEYLVGSKYKAAGLEVIPDKV